MLPDRRVAAAVRWVSCHHEFGVGKCTQGCDRDIETHWGNDLSDGHDAILRSPGEERGANRFESVHIDAAGHDGCASPG